MNKLLRYLLLICVVVLCGGGELWTDKGNLYVFSVYY